MLGFWNLGQAQQNYRYWIPYVDTVHFGGSRNYHYATIYAYEDTHVQIGENQYQLQAYESLEVNRPILREGLLIVSDQQIQINYLFITSHYQLYEDGYSLYSVLEESFLGNEYMIPLANSEVSILPIEDNTTITINNQDYGKSDKLIFSPTDTGEYTITATDQEDQETITIYIKQESN